MTVPIENRDAIGGVNPIWGAKATNRIPPTIGLFKMNEQLQLLINLQKIDSQIRSEEKLIKEITEKINRFEEEIKFKEGELKEEKDELTARERELRSKERSLEDANLHLQRCRDRVYMVKSNKELAAIDEEIEKVKKEKSLLEDENLVLMEAIEELSPRIKAKEKSLEEEKKKLSEEKGNCEGVLKQANEKLSLFLKHREEAIGKIDRVLLSEYQKLYKNRGGFAVVAMENDVCQSCNMTISAQLRNKIKKNEEIIRCENCARILYHPGEK
ncbi:hypothetical protein AUJ66_07470 [Candidatus Desantisbacteria bacterium CG1_02_38_46]|uniref:Uncharacterized protein n=3 Tax=unclassified Candidatus Desantisiibacteriota TaxID=3106372 RepID=A0A2H9PDT8_9BACT|nr:MAG: hypothetical protein AUJ66_07470 [Candidatus Desantisbacteria bacterium CG1_02_38_46]PIU51607.1 MAG: hypothetical protein COS91_03585 [Candidatus Desantisbacteria bacterium CG07_land_8_20_14_0_80_39_15]PIZ16731.1 MAG: hypothetical protein COY51_02075 [Candidatus Desantisbacteria bacterium CG_4_10_14_0_8_um_filter_39_17]